MDSKDFKKLFGEAARLNGYKSAFGGWFKDSIESIVVLELQKSSFSNSNYLNIKVFIQGAFKKVYTPNKDLIKSSTGHIINQIRDKEFLNLNNIMDDEKRKADLDKFFGDFIVPFTNKTLTKAGIKELAEQRKIFLLPAVKEELA